MKSVYKLVLSDGYNLCRAVQADDTKFLQDIDWSNEDLTISALESGVMNQSILMDGLANSSNETVLALLEATPCISRYINLKEPYRGNTPLILSTSKGWSYSRDNDKSKVPHSVVIKKLIEKGAHVNATDAYGRTALHYAYLHRDKEAINYLIQHGALVNVKDLQGQTPLQYLSYDYQQAQIILEKATGGRINCTYGLDADRFKPDMLVEIVGDKKSAAQPEIESKASADGKVDKKSPGKLLTYGSLCSAVLKNDAAFLDDIDWSYDKSYMCEQLQSGQMYKSILLCGIANSSNKTVLKLLDATPLIRKYVNLRDKYSEMRPLILATINGWDYSEDGTPTSMVIKKLIEKGADVNSMDKYGRTALHYACVRKDGEAVKYLIANGANTKIEDRNKQTPLDLTLCDYESATKILKEMKFGRHRDRLNLDVTHFNSPNQFKSLRELLDGVGVDGSPAANRLPTLADAENKYKCMVESLAVNGIFNSNASKPDVESKDEVGVDGSPAANRLRERSDAENKCRVESLAVDGIFNSDASKPDGESKKAKTVTFDFNPISSFLEAGEIFRPIF